MPEARSRTTVLSPTAETCRSGASPSAGSSVVTASSMLPARVTVVMRPVAAEATWTEPSVPMASTAPFSSWRTGLVVWAEKAP